MVINRTSIIQSTRTQWIIAVVALSLLVIALWLPYGLNFAGYDDEWTAMVAADRGTVWIASTLRPFVNLPYITGHLLTPDSFVGMNIILVITTLGRGIGIYALLRRLLPKNPALALVAAGLTSLYPGDVGFFALICINITSALVLFIGALIALVSYWQHPRWYVLLLMWVALIFSIGLYEISYPLILVSPLILIYLKSGINRRVIRVSLLWYAVPLIYVVINIIVQMTVRNVTSYQLSMVNPDNSLLAVLKGFTNVYIREFEQVWDWAVFSMPQGFSDYRTWLVMAVTTLFGIGLWTHMKAIEDTISRRQYVIVLLGSAATLGIGYSLFSITNFRDTYYRTLFYGLPGAAVTLAIVAWLLTRLRRMPRLIVAAIFFAIALIYLSRTDRLSALLVSITGIGFLIKPKWNFVVIGTSLVGYACAAMMGYHILQPFAALPAAQRQLAVSITRQAPAIKSKSLILWISTPAMKDQYFIVRNSSNIFQSMMQFVYKQYDIEAQLCVPNGVAWGAYNTSCKLEHDAVVISSTNQRSSNRWSYDRVIAFTYEPDKGAVLLNKIPPEMMSEPGAETYDPEILIDYNAPVPYRLQTVWLNFH